MVEVTQSDRDLFALFFDLPNPHSSRIGGYDDDPRMIAIARHRSEAEQRLMDDHCIEIAYGQQQLDELAAENTKLKEQLAAAEQRGRLAGLEEAKRSASQSAQ